MSCLEVIVLCIIAWVGGYMFKASGLTVKELISDLVN